MKKKNLHFFSINSSSRHEKRCQMLQRLFWLFQCSKNQWCPYYRFDDNNNINHKDIASTLGDFGIHFIGIKTLKEHFYKKMVNLTSYTLEFWIEYHSYSFYFQDWEKTKSKTKLIWEMMEKMTWQKIWTPYLHYMIKLNQISIP